MKMKNISSLILSLFFGLSALHAVPTDPSNPTATPAADAGDYINDLGNFVDHSGNSVVLTSNNSNTPIQVTTSQMLQFVFPSEINPYTSEYSSYTFSDSWLTDVTRTPYAFDWTGGATTQDAVIDCVNVAIKRNDPIIFKGCSLTVLYRRTPVDSAAVAATPNLTYIPGFFYIFSFKPAAAGTTTLTFSDQVNLYTYPITVVAQ
jgi:hypothetical protein